MYIIKTPYLTPSGKHLSNNNIIIYEVSDTSTSNVIVQGIRKFKLTSKGWKTSKYNERHYYRSHTNSLNEASTIDMSSPRYMYFKSFNNAYAAKCILINRIPSLFLSKIQVLTSKMNSVKQVQPQPHFMSDAIPELFI